MILLTLTLSQTTTIYQPIRLKPSGVLLPLFVTEHRLLMGCQRTDPQVNPRVVRCHLTGKQATGTILTVI